MIVGSSLPPHASLLSPTMAPHVGLVVHPCRLTELPEC